MSALDCRYELENVNLTVGSIFRAFCEGAESVKENASWTVSASEMVPYSLRVVRAKREGSAWVFDLTSYRTGKHGFEKILFRADDGSEWTASGPAFEVSSVLNPVQPPEGPYGPLGPLSLGIPLSWFFVGGLLVLFFGVGLVIKIARRISHRRFVEGLKSQEPSGGPLAEVHRRLRHLQRGNRIYSGAKEDAAEALDAVRALDQILVDYLEFRFHKRVRGRPWPQAVKDIIRDLPKSQRPKGEELRKLGREIKSALVAPKVEAKDAIQLTEAMRSLLESLDVREKRS